MATSQFGVLKPLKQYKRQQQQQQQQQQPQQQQLQQPHYSQFRFQQNAQLPASAPPPPLPPPSHNKQQQQQLQEQEQSQLEKQQKDQQQTDSRQQSAAPATNRNHHGDIHPHLQSQPRSPPLNDTVASPPQPPQHQFHNMTSVPVSGPIPGLNPDSANPPAVAMAAMGPPTATPSPTDTHMPLDSQRRHRTPTRPSKRRRSDNGSDLPLSSHTAPQPPAPHPLNKGPYNTLEDAIFSLQLHVFTSGYGVSQKRTVKEKLPSGKYDPEGDVIRKDFVCDKGGNEFVSQSRGERRRESKKCGCPWKAAVRRLRREGDRWFIEILDTNHNHPVTLPDEMHSLASYRRWQRENNAGIRSAIARLTRAAAMPARDIAAYLKGSIQDHDLDRIDKQILRALSMNDKEAPGVEREGGSVIFEMVARRPVIILQDTSGPSIAVNSHLGTPNQSPSVAGSLNQAAMVAPHQSTATYHHTFANTFAHASHPQPHHNSNPTTPAGGAGSATTIHSVYPAIP